MTASWDTFVALPEREQVTAALVVMRGVVDDAGHGFKYCKSPDGMCHYLRPTPTGPEADCLIARVLIRLGLPVLRLNTVQWGTDGEGEPYYMRGADQLAQTLKLHDDTGEVLKTAQKVQDDGYSWGAALERATKRAEQLASINGDDDNED